MGSTRPTTAASPNPCALNTSSTARRLSGAQATNNPPLVCGSGVGMASYLGMRSGQRVLGLSEGETGIAKATFQTRPLYTGKPWFLAPTVGAYKIRDRLNI